VYIHTHIYIYICMYILFCKQLKLEYGLGINDDDPKRFPYRHFLSITNCTRILPLIRHALADPA